MKITEKTNIVKKAAQPGGWASYEIYDRDQGHLIGRANDYRAAQRHAREYVERMSAPQTTQEEQRRIDKILGL